MVQSVPYRFDFSDFHSLFVVRLMRAELLCHFEFLAANVSCPPVTLSRAPSEFSSEVKHADVVGC